MTDNELRSIILQKFYDRRKEVAWINLKPDDFAPAIFPEDLYRICEDLNQYGLIKYKSMKIAAGIIGGLGKITGYGVDAIESEGASSPIGMTFTQNISISTSHGIQIGNHNVQSFISSVEQLIHQIDESNSAQEEKKEAKSRLLAFLTNPLVTSIIGGAAGGLISFLK